MSKKVIITGVSGQDGSYLADYLLETTDYEIYGMVRRLAKPDYSNISSALKSPRFKLVVGDLSDSHSIDSLIQKIKPDYFVNLAAQSFVGSSWDIPEQTFDVNATGVLRCLEAIRKHAPKCRFYNAGSSEEFGDVEYSPQNESHPYRARSPYGASKVAARQLVKVYRDSYKLYAVQGLLFNHESPRRGDEFVTQKIAKGVARIKKAVDKGESFDPIELGNLDAKRDWSHAKDFVRGIWLMLNQDSSEVFETRMAISFGRDINKWPAFPPKRMVERMMFTEEFVLSSNETHSIREFIELAFKRAGLDISNHANVHPISCDPEKETYNLVGKGDVVVKINPKFYRPAEVELLWGDSSKAKKYLGWEPEYSFEDLVNEMVDKALDS